MNISVKSKTPVKSIVLGVSIAVNALCAAMIILALSARPASISFTRMDDTSVAAAAVVVVPPSAPVVFNPVEITLKPGEQAALQFSFVSGGRQSNYLLTSLYDRDLIAVEPSGFGILITALAQGETLMQTLSSEGIIDIANIRIKP